MEKVNFEKVSGCKSEELTKPKNILLYNVLQLVTLSLVVIFGVVYLLGVL